MENGLRQMVVSIAIVDAALEYAGYGWKVVPLHDVSQNGMCSCKRLSHCPEGSRGKHPRLKEWQKVASHDEEQIIEWWDRWPSANLGVKLGRDSGIIDIECDDAEAEEKLNELFDGDMPITPTFRSRRGKHRIFQWRDDLPRNDKASFSIGKIDFKTGGGEKGSQSVFPPSRRPGVDYEWLVSPGECEPAPLSDEVLARIWNHDEGSFGETRAPSVRNALYEQEAVLEGSRDSVLYAEACALWNEQFKIYGHGAFESPESQAVVYNRLWAWNRSKCQPPLDDKAVAEKCEGGRAFIRDSATKSPEGSQVNLTALGLEWRENDWWPGKWRVEVIRCDPRKVRLFAPFLPKEFVEMAMDDYDEPVSVHRRILTETGTICLNSSPGFWPSVWNGLKGNRREKISPRIGLKAKLLQDAKWIDAPSEMTRENVILELIWEAIQSAPVMKDGEKLQRRGAVRRDQEGSVWFKFRALWEPMAKSDDRITRNELSEILRDVGAEDKVGAMTGNSRFKFISRENVKALEKRVTS